MGCPRTDAREHLAGRAVHVAGALAACLGIAGPAHALQPLAVFVERAHVTNPDARVARAAVAQRDAEASAAGGRLYPSLAASGTYTRNQYEVSFVLPPALGGTGQSLTIQPANQLDGVVMLSVPIVDIGAWERRAAAKATLEAAAKDIAVTEIDVERRVTRGYYQLLASEAVLGSAGRALDIAKEHLKLTRNKRDAGTASELDIQRSEADVARAEQDIAAATFAVVTGRRRLATESGVDPEPATTFPEDDLHEEAPLASWLGGADAVPSVAAARASREASEQSARAAGAAWYPTLGASAQERFTNATSFSGHSASFLLQATASWRLDATIPGTVRAQQAATLASQAREAKARRDAEDAIFQAWQQVRANIDTARSARAQVRATALAAGLARDRYQSGVATQLDMLQAEQDAFRADVGRIQADAELAYARAALRLNAGARAKGGAS